LFFTVAANAATAQPEAPMQLCSPISAEDCATPPHWLKQPKMTLSALPAGSESEAVIGLNLVIGANGSVQNVESSNSTDDTRKQQVISSAWDWKFAPATFQGRAVPVEVRVIVQVPPTGSARLMLGPWRASWATAADLQRIFDDASQAFGRSDYREAVARSRQLIAMEPLFRRIRLILGESLVDLQEYDQAEAILQEEIKLDPKSPFAYNTLGWAYQRHGKYGEAITQYKKQIEVTPEAFTPLANLGVQLCARKRCGEAMPELEKALELSPGQARILLAQGKCDVDLGNTAKGIAEMEQAANKANSSSYWNEAAYRLTEQNVELDRAQKWSERAISIESAFLRDLSLDHVTPTQMKLVNATSNYWDTLGWVYFRMGKDDRALSYVDAAWRMHPTPTKGDHLGQIYEKLGRSEDAIHAYAMAVAATDLSMRGESSPEDLAEARERLTRIASPGADVADLIARGRAALASLNSISVENAAKRTGEADFTMKIVGGKIVEVQEFKGDASFAPFSEILRKSSLPVLVPEGSGLEILRRGTLSCKTETSECNFTLLTTQQALDLATKEDGGSSESASN
jgi:tetratricopeptide (TPR) repeat protein